MDRGTENSAQLPATKVVMIGHYGVGKTALCRRMQDEVFSHSTNTTIGIDFFSKRCDKHNVTLNIWDTAGQERFHSVTTSYYRVADIFLVVFSVQDRESFEKVPFYLNEIEHFRKNENIPVVLVGNMSHEYISESSLPLTPKPAVAHSEAAEFAVSNQLPYYETSARTDMASVKRLFYSVASIAKESMHFDEQKMDDSNNTNLDQNSFSKISCCF
jgi:Ras-related protein Rab-1A